MSYWYGIPGYPSNIVAIRSEHKKIGNLKLIKFEDIDKNLLLTISFQFKTNNWPKKAQLEKSWKRWGFCNVEPDSRLVYFKFPLGPVRFKLMLGDLHSNNPSFAVNPLYWRLTFNIGTALSPYYVHLRDIITMNLLDKGYLTLHGSCLCTASGEACLIVAPPETGKTITALYGQQLGYGLLSEDLVVSDGINILPSLISGQQVYSPAFLNMQKGLKAKIKRVSANMIERTGLAYPGLLAKIGGSIIPPPYNKPVKLTHIFFLARGPRSMVTPMKPDDSLAKLLIIDRGEFHWRSNPVLLAYDYHTMLLDIPSILRKEDALLHTVAEKGKNCYQLEAPNPYEYIKLIQEIFPL